MRLSKFLFGFAILFLILACQTSPDIQLDPSKIKVELDSIMLLDQLHRNELNSLYAEYGYDSDEFQTVLKKQNAIDSSNLIYVEDLISRYGKYPGKDLVGNSASEVAFFVLQHAPDSIQTKYLDLILEAAENKDLKKGLVAMFHDRYLINIGEPQIYGSQVGRREELDSVTGKKNVIQFLYPIKDTTKIDSVRLWNGMLPLEDYLNGFGLSRWE